VEVEAVLTLVEITLVIQVLLDQVVLVDQVVVVLLLVVVEDLVLPDKVTTVGLIVVEPAYTLLVVEEEPELLDRGVQAAAVLEQAVSARNHQ
jgi:hypothetical protein